MSDEPVQPRYAAYAAAHGHTPVQRLAADHKAHPGGPMAGFMIWIRQRWREWDEDHGTTAEHSRTLPEHEAFDAWLAGAGQQALALDINGAAA